MTPRTFCYWLQGYFELVNPQEVPAASIEVIEAHLNIVDDKSEGFCAWLQGVMDMGDKTIWNASQTQKVKERLAQEFLNVIDASYEDSLRSALNQIHKGLPPKQLTQNHSHLSEASSRPRDILC